MGIPAHYALMAHRLPSSLSVNPKFTKSLQGRTLRLVIAIRSDTVMSQVDLQCGPYRVVSLISTEGVRELGLEVGSIAMAQIKATNVSLQIPRGGNL